MEWVSRIAKLSNSTKVSLSACAKETSNNAMKEYIKADIFQSFQIRHLSSMNTREPIRSTIVDNLEIDSRLYRVISYK